MRDLEEIRARVEAATGGEWQAAPNHGDAVISLGSGRKLCPAEERYYGGAVIGESMHPADREFVQHSRQDVIDLLDEAALARDFWADIRSALSPGRMRGFDGPDGVSKDEVIDDIAAALDRHDKAMGVTND